MSNLSYPSETEPSNPHCFRKGAICDSVNRNTLCSMVVSPRNGIRVLSSRFLGTFYSSVGSTNRRLGFVRYWMPELRLSHLLSGFWTMLFSKKSTSASVSTRRQIVKIWAFNSMKLRNQSDFRLIQDFLIEGDKNDGAFERSSSIFGDSTFQQLPRTKIILPTFGISALPNVPLSIGRVLSNINESIWAHIHI